MTASKYWTFIGIWVVLYLGLPFLIPFFIQGAIEATDATSIGGASGALTVIGASYGIMVINLLIALGLSWTAFHRLKEVGWSPLFVIFFYCALSSGLTGTSATPFGGYAFSMFFGWALIPVIGFLVFLGFYEDDVSSTSSQDIRILEISKAVIIGCSIFCTLMTYKSGILNLKAIPFMAQLFMGIADFFPSFYKLIRATGLSPYTLRTVATVLLILSLAIHWYVVMQADDDAEKETRVNHRTPIPSQRNQGFGQRR